MAAKIRANRRKLRDELIIHRQKLLFFNKKIVLPTPICKINQLIRIDDKKASRLHCGLPFHSYANRFCCLFLIFGINGPKYKIPIIAAGEIRKVLHIDRAVLSVGSALPIT